MLEIKESLIEDSGLGVFATEDISKGSILTEYYGQVCLDNVIPSDADRLAMLKISGFLTVGNRKEYNVHKCGQIINDYALINELTITNTTSLENSVLEYHKESLNHCNVEAIAQNNKHYISSKRLIKAGEELYLYYGQAYWLSVILTKTKPTSKKYNLISDYLKKFNRDNALLDKLWAFKMNKNKKYN